MFQFASYQVPAAEYFCPEARTRAIEQQQFSHWGQPEYYPAPYPVQTSAFAFPGFAPQQRGYQTFGGYPQSRPQQYGGVQPRPEPSLAERELEVRLAEEHLARLKAEHRLKLKEREIAELQRRSSHPAFVGRTARPAAPEAKVQRDEYADLLSSFRVPEPVSRKTRETAEPKQSSSTVNPKGFKVRYDIIQAITNSLSDSVGQIADPSASAKPTTFPSKSAPFSSGGAPSVKGKGKETVFSSGTTSTDVMNALERVESIEDNFKRIEAHFVFPPQLDFISTSSNISSTSDNLRQLAFTARNYPVRYYEQTLTSLLNRLDLIESHSNEELRQRRKNVVSSIGKALEQLEWEIAGRWKAKLAGEQKKESCQLSGSSEEKPSTAQVALPVRIPIINSSVAEEEGARSEAESLTSNAEEPGQEEVVNELAPPSQDESTPVLEEPREIEVPEVLSQETERGVEFTVPEIPEPAPSNDEERTIPVEHKFQSGWELAHAHDQPSEAEDGSTEDIPPGPT